MISADFTSTRSEIQKDRAALQHAARARATSTATTQSTHTEAEASESRDQQSYTLAPDDVAQSVARSQQRQQVSPLEIPTAFFDDSPQYASAPSERTSLGQIAANAEELAALESMLPAMVRGNMPCFAPSSCDVQQQQQYQQAATQPVPFPWESFSPGNFFYRQLLEARDRR